MPPWKRSRWYRGAVPFQHEKILQFFWTSGFFLVKDMLISPSEKSCFYVLVHILVQCSRNNEKKYAIFIFGVITDFINNFSWASQNMCNVLNLISVFMSFFSAILKIWLIFYHTLVTNSGGLSTDMKKIIIW